VVLQAEGHNSPIHGLCHLQDLPHLQTMLVLCHAQGLAKLLEAML
jgi:hypothetical protein